MIQSAIIQTELDNRQFAPGEALRGRVTWRANAALASAELRLFHYTTGKGTRDTTVVEVRRWKSPGAVGDEPFSFELPAGPYTFSGKLVSLTWALELVLEPGHHHERLEFVVSPTAHEIDLYRHPLPEGIDDKSAKKGIRFGTA